MYRVKVSKWGNSQGIRISAEVMRKKNIHIGDKVHVDISQPRCNHKQSPRERRNAKLLCKNAERKAFCIDGRLSSAIDRYVLDSHAVATTDMHKTTTVRACFLRSIPLAFLDGAPDASRLLLFQY